MIYLLILFVLALLFYWCYDYLERIELKHHGIKTIGTIVQNKEMAAKSMYRLGGNINMPTIQFKTTEGKEIIGQPIIGFVTQHEVVVPSSIRIIYDKKKPNRFMIASS